MQALVAIRQEADLQRLDQLFDVPGAAEQRRHHHQRTRVCRYPQREIHPRQGMWRHQQRRQPVDQCHGQVAHRQQPEQAERRQPPRRHAESQSLGEQADTEDYAEQHDAAQIQREGETTRCSTQNGCAGMADFGRPLQFRQALVDQIEADVPRAFAEAAGRFGKRRRTRQLDRLAGHFALRQGALPGNLLGGVAVAIAGGKIHPAINARRIFPQSTLDDTGGLDELAPVDRPKHPQAADAVADRNLIGGLALIFGLHQLFDRQARFGEALLDPGQGQGQRRAPPLQAARQLGDEGADHRRTGARHVGDHQDQTFRVLLGNLGHPVCPGIGQISFVPTRRDAYPDTPEIFDQRQSQHDRDGPQLTKLEGGDGLIGGDEATEAFGSHASVAVRDDFQGNIIDPRTAGRRPARQARQFPAVALGQVPLGGADLLFDEVKIVEQPFRGRSDSAVLGDRRGHPPAHPDQGAFVGSQARQQQIRGVDLGKIVCRGENPAVLLHLIGAEQLRSQRRFAVA
ncbi:MAG: hypothetical protein CAPSK01_003332 [Candidatus Accumulibacter vicinus]|uniref:Uncharacterized protein n=1 Tax=Candidatus Accumulibacter vicinus TaxID=2954382 RepID=A0A084XXM1_9PROT|nr:MAG: hypothetical protein CAPSK01_003332 [Candidatus Accumulibacter vicinus]